MGAGRSLVMRSLRRVNACIPGSGNYSRGLNHITQLPGDVGRGSDKAADELLELVYHELRKRAEGFLARERPGQTLQATALVHEAWLKLGGDQAQSWNGESHFLAAATKAMRRILIDRARSKARVKHGEGHKAVNLEDVDVANPETDGETLLAINDALDKFALEDPQKARLVELRYFVGMSIPEAARALGIAEATAKRHWVYARAWLFEELRSNA
jgi:RNA polymerase sigma factor (TIGR02999 family)